MGRLFGTDGIRGIAGSELTSECAYRLGLAIAALYRGETEKPCVLIGKDTRHSGDMLEAAIAAGLCAGGADVCLLGVVPTPAVAYLVREQKKNAGVMISASHNPAVYNGLKVFGGEGYKLPDADEEKVEAVILGETPVEVMTGNKIGRVFADSDARLLYEAHLKSALEEAVNPGSRRILFDLSCGSASYTAKDVFTKENVFGYETAFRADQPDGMNINDGCGSTHLKALSEEVVRGGYDMGIAFDGDADRCLLVDEAGREIDGDMMIARLAVEMKKDGQLQQNTAVVTKLSNLGFHRAAKQYGFDVAVTDVGDRYVLEEMLRSGAGIGGEQSGHIILTAYATTGDGQITAARVLSLMAKNPGRKASEVFCTMRRLPQVMRNVTVPGMQKEAIMADETLLAMVKEIADRLGNDGRILLRPSGTEALIRIMLEGDDEAALAREAERVAAYIGTLC